MVREKSAKNDNKGTVPESRETDFNMAPSLNQNLSFDEAIKHFKERKIKFSYMELAGLRLIRSVVTVDSVESAACDTYGRLEKSSAPVVGTYDQLDASEDLSSGGFKLPDGIAYTNAAFLISDQNAFETNCTVFNKRGSTYNGIRVNFKGSALRQFSEAYEYAVSKCAAYDKRAQPGVNDGFFREALREILLNAIIHRNYCEAGQIQVNIYDEHIDIVSPGGLIKGIVMKDIIGGAQNEGGIYATGALNSGPEASTGKETTGRLGGPEASTGTEPTGSPGWTGRIGSTGKIGSTGSTEATVGTGGILTVKHVANLRNKSLAAVFGRLGLFSGSGTTIKHIISEYSGCLLEPVFRHTPASFSVSLPKMIGGNTPIRGYGQLKEDLVLKLISQKGSITRNEVEVIFKSSRNTAINLLDGLLDEGKIVKIGSARTVRYILPQ